MVYTYVPPPKLPPVLSRYNPHHDDKGKFTTAPGDFSAKVSAALDDGSAWSACHATTGSTGAGQALQDYGRPETEFPPGQTPYYVRVNGGLRTNRGGPLGDPDADRVRDGLDELFSTHAPARDKDIVVTRGVRNKQQTFGGEPTVGMVFVDHGYQSTTSNRATDVSRFLSAGGANMRVLVPKHVPALANNQHLDSGEILLPRGKQYRIVNDNGIDANGVHQLDVEVVA